jgi:hypothetical protein
MGNFTMTESSPHGYEDTYLAGQGGYGLDTLTADEALTTPEQNYVKEAPRFLDQAEDATRTNTFSYMDLAHAVTVLDDEDAPDRRVVTMTEHEGLVALRSFFEGVVAADGYDAQTAKGMLENLTFIGEKEYEEACHGIAEYWKTYLDEDNRNTLCIPLGITAEGERRKSDTYLMERVLSTFSDEELQKYQGKITTRLDEVDQPPEHTKIVLLDDWMVSGKQMAFAYQSIAQNERYADYKDSIEVQVIVESDFNLKNGFGVYESADPGSPYHNVPVRSYYKAHKTHGSASIGNRSHITGTHSSVDYNFEQPLSSIVADLNKESEAAGEGRPHRMPPLTNVIRSYRYGEPLVVIGHDGEFIRAKELAAARELRNKWLDELLDPAGSLPKVAVVEDGTVLDGSNPTYNMSGYRVYNGNGEQVGLFRLTSEPDADLPGQTVKHLTWIETASDQEYDKAMYLNILKMLPDSATLVPDENMEPGPYRTWEWLASNHLAVRNGSEREVVDEQAAPAFKSMVPDSRLLYRALHQLDQSS